MSKISKVEAVRIIFRCAKLYKDNLSGNNVLFVSPYNDKQEYFEAFFSPGNFLHLTGIKTNSKRERFFDAALNERLSPADIEFESGGTTELKLSILPQLMSIHTTARMVGNYDNSRPLLIADKFAGTVTSAIGFLNVNGIYIPKSALRVDMRNITIKTTRRKVIAIFIKPRNNPLYGRLTYISKDLLIDDDIFAPSIREKIDMMNLTAAFPLPRKAVQQNLAEAKGKPAGPNMD